MKGDFSRVTFGSEKHYTSVRMQQGRVQLDADWNELVDISAYRTNAQALDVIGQNGAPLSNAGFGLAAKVSELPAEQQPEASSQPPLANGDFFISAGRYYVDGLLCENEAPVAYSRQPDLPDAKLPPAPGAYLVYLDVWERHLGAVDDPDMLEAALGGPDTATRTKLVWQVKLFTPSEANLTPDAILGEWTASIAPSTGKLRARSQPAPSDNGPCVLSPTAGYTRLENQLYRVEVHDKGELGEATFKWSRDNGSIVAAWLFQQGNELTVSSTGPDEAISFQHDEHVELIDDTRELANTPGTLVRVTDVTPGTLVIDPGDASIALVEFPRHPKVRRWNTAGDTGSQTIAVPASNDGWLPLESGVEIKFEPGTYATGDYWHIPARTTLGSVVWPFDEAQPPQGIRHHYARLALLAFDGSQLTVVQDYRQLFAGATEQLSLFMLGGDGQQAAPGQPLLQPLQVGVSNGSRPVAGATVRFLVATGAGVLEGTGSMVQVLTDASGVASCRWALDAANATQRVTVTLLDADGASIHLPVHFNARLAVTGLDPGMHVVAITLADKTPLQNDSEVTVAQLADGILLLCDAEIAKGSVSRATCFLTLELPSTVGHFGYQNVTLNAAASVVDLRIIRWAPAPATGTWLKDDLFKTIGLLPERRVLARLTLLGDFIWSTDDPPRYLDGDVFGIPKSLGTVTSTAVRLPSGNGRRGGSLQMWFWLVEGEVTIAIEPSVAVVRVGGLLDHTYGLEQNVIFTVTVQGTSNTAVELSVNGVGGGNAELGTIKPGASPALWIYDPPSNVRVSREFTITAKSLAAPSKTDTATVTVINLSGIPLDPLGGSTLP